MKKIMLALAGGTGQFIITFLRSLLVGGITVAFLILNINNFTDSSYGVVNLVIIMSVFTFFPVFFVLLVELFFFELRKKQKVVKQGENKLKQSDL